MILFYTNETKYFRLRLSFELCWDQKKYLHDIVAQLPCLLGYLGLGIGHTDTYNLFFLFSLKTTHIVTLVLLMPRRLGWG